MAAGAYGQQESTHINPNPTYAQVESMAPGTTNQCQPVPAYRLGGIGLEPKAHRCSDQPGEGKLEALSPHSWMAPSMIIEVTPSTTIFVPQRQHGIRVWRVGADL